MSQFQKYNDYKSSGVEWLGDVPRHWEVRRIKTISRVKRGASPRPIDDPRYFNDEGEFSWVRIADVSANNHYLTSTVQKLSKLGASLSVKIYPNELFISIAGTVGKPMIAQIKCCIHDGFVYFPDNNFNQEFFYRLFETGQPYLGLGKFGTQLNLNTETIGEIRIPLPPLAEQTAIVHYLDQKTAQIDTAIAQKQRMIELLKERRQILIHRAVTQGLDPSVKMKDSGVEWIGVVPEHWNIVKTKFITNFVYDGTHGSYPRVSNGYRLLSVRNIIDDKFVFRDDDSCVSEKHFKEISSKFLIKEGDIQLAIVGATLGKAAIVDKYDELFVTQRSVCTIRVNENQCLTKFLFYFIKSEPFQSYLWLNAGFSAQPGVYLGTIQNSYVPLPSIEEQERIIANIEFVNQKLATAIRLKESEIAKLKEYKGSLINSVVTGKVRVV